MNAYGMQSGGSGVPPVPQNIFATYSSSSATSTGKLLAQQRLASLLYPGEQSLTKFGWADRVKEYLAEIKLSREDYPPGVRRLSHVMTHKKGSQEWMKAVPPICKQSKLRSDASASTLKRRLRRQTSKRLPRRQRPPSRV